MYPSITQVNDPSVAHLYLLWALGDTKSRNIQGAPHVPQTMSTDHWYMLDRDAEYTCIVTSPPPHFSSPSLVRTSTGVKYLLSSVVGIQLERELKTDCPGLGWGCQWGRRQVPLA